MSTMTASTSVAPESGPLPQGGFVAGSVLAIALTGAAVAWLPVLAWLPLGALVGVLLLASARFRVAFVVLGGLAVLQSSQDLSPLKIGYLVGVVVAVGTASFNLRTLESTESYRLMRPLLRVSLLFLGLVVLSAVVARLHGNPASAWLRDAAPFLLFAFVPILAMDICSSVSRRYLLVMFVLVGVLATASFAVEWLDRRHLADLGLNRIALPSLFLAAALFSYEVSEALQGKGNRAAWTALAALSFSVLLITGTRGVFVLLAAPLAITFTGGGSFARRSLRVVVLGGVAVLLVLVFMQVLTRLTGADMGAATERLASVQRLMRDRESDQSYAQREDQTRVAWRAFLSEPLVGTGPGYAFQWGAADREVQTNFNIDTAVSFPAKFGLAGIAIFIALAVGFSVFLRNLGRRAGPTVPRAALLGFAAVTLLSLPLGSPFEDKGFSFGLVLLVALGLAELRVNHRRPPSAAGTETGLHPEARR